MDTIYTEFNSSLLTQGKLGKTHHMQQRTWMLGGCVEEWHIPQVSEGATNCNQRMTEQFTSGSLGDISVQMECATPPHVHPAFGCVAVRDGFYQAFPSLVPRPSLASFPGLLCLQF